MLLIIGLILVSKVIEAAAVTAGIAIVALPAARHLIKFHKGL